jgi:hypothetical protein
MPVEGFLSLLVGHLQEEQKCQLFDVILVRKAVISKDVAIVPQFLNNHFTVAHRSALSLFYRASGRPLGSTAVK